MQGSAHVVILGGGAAGLRAAGMLQAAEVDFVLFEARSRLGGRVLTVDEKGDLGPGFDLGPSWFWPESQPRITRLVDQLGLEHFPQDRNGDALFEHWHQGRVQVFRGPHRVADSRRLTGGTARLIRALADRVPDERIRLNTRITHMTLDEEGVTLRATPELTIRTRHVIAALPPRLLGATVEFSPTIDPATVRLWSETPTWMAPHAKFFALYRAPFWRHQGLSGSVQSTVGPLAEIHDATSETGAALFGFVGIPACERAKIDLAKIEAAPLDQLARLFGRVAGSPQAILFKDWATDDLTSVDADRTAFGHPEPHTGRWISAPWEGRLLLAGSETAITDPGYLEGALEAAERSVNELTSFARLNPLPPRTISDS